MPEYGIDPEINGTRGISRSALLLRVVIGLVLVGTALVLTIGSRRNRLEILVDFLPQSVPAGGNGIMSVRIRPREEAAEGSRLVFSAASRPQISVRAPEGISFGRPVDYIHDSRDHLPMDFSVDRGLAPGDYQLEVTASAEFLPGDADMVVPVKQKSTVTLSVIAALPEKDKPAEK